MLFTEVLTKISSDTADLQIIRCSCLAQRRRRHFKRIAEKTFVYNHAIAVNDLLINFFVFTVSCSYASMLLLDETLISLKGGLHKFFVM